MSLTQPTQQQIEAGQAVYSNRTLAIYDFVVLWLSNHYIWRCPTKTLLAHYNRYISANHLDIGVGSGYFLAHCQFPSTSVRLALMDMNESVLSYAANRVAHLNPECITHNIFDAPPANTPPFDSMGINYLLHCVPGSMAQKVDAIASLKPLLNSGATVFGSTILQSASQYSWVAKKLMAVYNKKGIFSNTGDRLEDLTRALEKHFTRVEVDVVGSVAVFSACAE